MFTAAYSRHMFVWLTYSQTLSAVIAGCEAARDVGSIRWPHDGELDSMVLVEGHGPPRFESGKW